MNVAIGDSTAVMAEFVAGAAIGPEARDWAAIAFRDTVGVMLAGSHEPAAEVARAVADAEGAGGGPCRVVGTAMRSGPQLAAFVNGVAAHALDYDDMCFVSLAHPSCVLVPTLLAVGELVSAPASLLLDAYVAGFEIECRLGLVMNPRHYHQRGWHCTSSIGTLGAAAAAARVLGLDAARTRHALGIAASSACGLKENLGTMVKPLHAGLAARNGVTAAQLAQRGFAASAHAIDGPQGYLTAMDSEGRPLEDAVADLGVRWEILDSGITVKLYPSCAATHPPLDALLALTQRARVSAADVDRIDVEVDSMTPRLLIHPSPTTGLEAKFSMPYCAAAALVYGPPDLTMFDVDHIRNPAVQALIPRVTLRANPALDSAAPLSQARVTMRLRDGRELVQTSDGARGYPGRLTDDELATKFTGCATATLTAAGAAAAWAALRDIERIANVRDFTALVAAS